MPVARRLPATEEVNAARTPRWTSTFCFFLNPEVTSLAEIFGCWGTIGGGGGACAVEAVTFSVQPASLPVDMEYWSVAYSNQVPFGSLLLNAADRVRPAAPRA